VVGVRKLRPATISSIPPHNPNNCWVSMGRPPTETKKVAYMKVVLVYYSGPIDKWPLLRYDSGELGVTKEKLLRDPH